MIPSVQHALTAQEPTKKTFVIRDVYYTEPFSWTKTKREWDHLGRRFDSVMQPQPMVDIYMPGWGESYGEMAASACSCSPTSSENAAANAGNVTNDRGQHINWTKPRKVRKVPVIVVVHGGGWHRGGRNVEWRGAPPISRALAPHGFITVAVSYRLSSPLAISLLMRCALVALVLAGIVKAITFAFAPKLAFWKIYVTILGALVVFTAGFKSRPSQTPAKHPDHVNDVAKAITWVRHNISRVFPRPLESLPTVEVGPEVPPVDVEQGEEPEILVADPDQIYLVGHSAGGHLVALVSIDPTYLNAADEAYRKEFPDYVYKGQEEKHSPAPEPVAANAVQIEDRQSPEDSQLASLPKPTVSPQHADAPSETDVLSSGLTLDSAEHCSPANNNDRLAHFSTPLSPLSPGTDEASSTVVRAVQHVLDEVDYHQQEEARLLSEEKEQVAEISPATDESSASGASAAATAISGAKKSLLPFPIRGVIPISGIYDLLRPLRQSVYHPMNFFFHIFYTYSAFGYSDKTKMGASPLHKLREYFPDTVGDALPPFTVLNAISDFGLELGGQVFVDELRKKGAKASYAVIDNTNHASIVSRFTTYDAYRVVLSSLDGRVVIREQAESEVVTTTSTTTTEDEAAGTMTTTTTRTTTTTTTTTTSVTTQQE